jgi:predicted Na+-dependent transporter
MKSMFLLIIALSLVAAGAAGQWLEIDVFKPYAIWFLGGGLVILCSVTLRITYYRTGYNWSKASNQPRQKDLCH